jgi:hypothetical protein
MPVIKAPIKNAILGNPAFKIYLKQSDLEEAAREKVDNKRLAVSTLVISEFQNGKGGSKCLNKNK